MRIGIYNRYWNTLGGGERHIATVARALASAKDCEVVLIGTEPFSIEELARRFQLDVTGFRSVVWPPDSCQVLAPRSADYDVFINSTYGSSLPSAAPRSVYFCFFPHVDPDLQPLNPTGRPQAAIQPVAGHYAVGSDGACWFRGQGAVTVPAPLPPETVVRIPARAARTSRITSIRARQQELQWSSHHRYLAVDLAPVLRPTDPQVELSIAAATVCPAERGESPDRRQLGFCLELGVPAPSPTIPSAHWLSTYDTIIANSEYTARWVGRRWHREAAVITPTIETDLFRPPVSDTKREPVILSVGRFFASGHGHNKKHDALIEVFKTMIDQRLLSSEWELHLVGGRHWDHPDHIRYYDQLQDLAKGYPIRFFPDLPLPDLLRKYQTASLFWHAAGIGESEDEFPERFEHFGITTCEAMACGLIPIVIDRAGQKEIIRDGVNGFTFSNAIELIQKTIECLSLVNTPAAGRMLEAARTTVQRYSPLVARSAALRVFFGGPTGPAHSRANPAWVGRLARLCRGRSRTPARQPGSP